MRPGRGFTVPFPVAVSLAPQRRRPQLLCGGQGPVAECGHVPPPVCVCRPREHFCNPQRGRSCQASALLAHRAADPLRTRGFGVNALVPCIVWGSVPWRTGLVLMYSGWVPLCKAIVFHTGWSGGCLLSRFKEHSTQPHAADLCPPRDSMHSTGCARAVARPATRFCTTDGILTLILDGEGGGGTAASTCYAGDCQ